MIASKRYANRLYKVGDGDKLDIVDVDPYYLTFAETLINNNVEVIRSIKIVREYHNLGLKEAKDVVDCARARLDKESWDEVHKCHVPYNDHKGTTI